MNPLRSYERLMELLADRALEGLSAEQEAELERLLLWHPEVNPLALDLAAAALHRASSEPLLPTPPGLVERIERQARGETSAEAPVPSTPRPKRRRLLAAVAWSGWAVAAAALLAALSPWRPVDPSPSVLRQRLLGEGGTMLVQATPGTEPGAGGDVAWHGGKQEGYLRLVGLPANDPRRLQYQLWIFDAGRDARFPVDGGVFDVPPGREVVVPIRAKLPVNEPTLFAVTSEAPGGVVVSDRKRIVVSAKAP
jgi:hypothetical protein